MSSEDKIELTKRDRYVIGFFLVMVLLLIVNLVENRVLEHILLILDLSSLGVLVCYHFSLITKKKELKIFFLVTLGCGLFLPYLFTWIHELGHTITSPLNTDTFSPGYNYITWTSIGDISYVQIDLYKNGVLLETVSSYETNDGSYFWYIYDDEYIEGSSYQIIILDYYDNSIYDYSYYFTIESSDAYIQPIFLSVLLSIIIPIVVVVVLTIVGVLIYRRRKQIILITREIPVKEEPVKSQEKKLPRITYCSSCGVEILDITGDFCSECGASIK